MPESNRNAIRISKGAGKFPTPLFCEKGITVKKDMLKSWSLIYEKHNF